MPQQVHEGWLLLELISQKACQGKDLQGCELC